MQTKKSLGQNFLRDPKILKKIADFARIEKTDTVVEVGPGEGTLTKLLLERAKKVIVIEKDEKLAKLLGEKFKSQISKSKLEIICGDVLKIAKLFENYVLVGNIPYYITGALFKKFLSETNNKPKSITFVVQKEVAERIMGSHFAKASRDKSRGKESILSVSIKVYGEPEFGEIIKAGSFWPKPKVDSAVIAIRNISNKNFLRCHLRKKCPEGDTLGNSEKKFFEILKKGFSHKRKLLMRNLNTSKEILKKCKIEEKARAEELKVGDWICLTKNL